MSGTCENLLKIVAINESLHLGSEKSPPYGRAQRLTRPKCAFLGKITRQIKNFFGCFQREERNEKWTTKRYGERGEKWELLIFTLCHRAQDFPTFPEPNFPSAYFEICTHVQKFPTKFQRNFKNIFNKIFNEIFNKFFTKFSNNISKFFITKAQLAFVCNPA